MQETTQQRVLERIRLRPGSGSASIARSLGMAPAAVRHHLRVLEQQGRIECGPPASSKLRGRPHKTYRLADRWRGDNLAALARSLLQILSGSPEDGASGRVQAADQLATRLLGSWGMPESSPGMASRLSWLMERLNESRYEARWEAAAEGPRVIFGHCPYAALVREHPELCRMDADLVGRALGSPATQASRIDPAAGFAGQCVFLLGLPRSWAASDPSRQQRATP
jgi:predicted ArsR family transcriptional regulator